MISLFPSDAPSFSDVAAVAEVLIAVFLLVGMFVVRRGRVRVHMYLQSSLILVNLPIVLTWMVPEYLEYVLPGLPGELAQPFYLFPTIMLVAGGIAEAVGVYIVLVAATNWLPERLRFRNYKWVMRSELVLWWTVVLLGLSTYYLWYIGGASS